MLCVVCSVLFVGVCLSMVCVVCGSLLFVVRRCCCSLVIVCCLVLRSLLFRWVLFEVWRFGCQLLLDLVVVCC